jgi:beta-lactamase class A
VDRLISADLERENRMTVAVSTPELLDEVRAAFDRAGATGAVHARPVDAPGPELAVDADAVQVAASTYKIAVLLEVACQAADGQLDPTRRIRIPVDRHSLGINGIATFLDDVEMSVRDLAMLMMQISDNTATDVVQDVVGTDRVSARLAALGLTGTTIRTDCRGLIEGITEELGGDPLNLPEDELRAALLASPALAGRTGNTTTARDMTTLLSMIWRDEAGPAEACAQVRRVMQAQFAPHRLSTAYRDGPVIAGKTGTFFGGVRNEVGVVDFGGGERFAVAVFLRQRHNDLRDGRADAAIGAAARLMVDHLRGVA